MRLRKCEQTITLTHTTTRRIWAELETKCRFIWRRKKRGRSGRVIFSLMVPGTSWKKQQNKIISQIISLKIKHWRQWRFMARHGFQQWHESRWLDTAVWLVCMFKQTVMIVLQDGQEGKIEINLFSGPQLSWAELKVTKNMINCRQVFARRLPFVFCLCNANLMLIYFC